MLPGSRESWSTAEFKDSVAFNCVLCSGSPGSGEQVKATPAPGRAVDGLSLSILIFGDFCGSDSRFQHSGAGRRHGGSS